MIFFVGCTLTCNLLLMLIVNDYNWTAGTFIVIVPVQIPCNGVAHWLCIPPMSSAFFF